MAKRWLIVFPGYKLMYFFNTEVACQRIVVIPTNKLCPDDFRDVGEALVVQNSINVVPALLAKLLVGSQLLSLFVLGLQFV